MQVVHFIHSDPVLEKYEMKDSDYLLGHFEHLGDYAASTVVGTVGRGRPCSDI